MDADGQQHYLYDANGNVGQLVDGEGALIAAYEYDAYGNTVQITGSKAAENSFRFSTKYYDALSGLYYYGYRYYSSELGRWVSRDPLGENGGVNLYGFVKNSPPTLVDYLGNYTLGDAETSICEDACANVAGLFKSFCLDKCYNNLVDQEVFAEWLMLEEKDKSWLEELTPCPKDLCISGGKPQNPNSTLWENPKDCNNPEHPGGVYEMRSHATPSGHGNQCIYGEVKKGEAPILTNIPAAGSADYKHWRNLTEHASHDYFTWKLAVKLWKQWDYFNVRPMIIEK